MFNGQSQNLCDKIPFSTTVDNTIRAGEVLFFNISGLPGVVNHLCICILILFVLIDGN